MKRSFFIIIILLILWSFFIEPNLLIVKNYNIDNEKLRGIRIVFVGDFHIKPNQNKRLIQIVNLINKQEPDLVLSIGDFVNGHELKSTMPINKILMELKGIKAPLYTVIGNHDYWVYDDNAEKIIADMGFNVLSNSNTLVKINDKSFYIAGVQDLTTQTPDIEKALYKTSTPTILLTHSPDIFPNIPETVDLTLAGHLHGGQVRLPFIGSLITPSNYGNKYSQGLIKENHKKMIVTKGIGNSILPVRFNCVPEIVVIDFK